MSTHTTVYLADGRHIDIGHQSVQDWRYEVANADTTLGLADWYTECGEQNTEEIQGTAEFAPRCGDFPGDDHAQHVRRVTNVSQTGPMQFGSPHASAWVCGRKSCLIDALAWVELSTGEKAQWTEDMGLTWKELSFPEGTTFELEDNADDDTGEQ